jgi:hypothetical protein
LRRWSCRKRGLLGLVFAVNARSLPTRALIPALFLGAAIGLATGYAAYLSKRKATAFQTEDHVWQNAVAHTNGFLDWIDAAVQARANLLRASVWALGLGILFLPSAFVEVHESSSSTPPPSPSIAIAWPSPSAAEPSLQADLEKILFEAQVKETASERDEIRKTAASPEPAAIMVGPLRVSIAEAGLWALAAVFGSLLVVRTARSES